MTITCTQFPKFSLDRWPQILPRPYFSSKPGQIGYELIQKDWVQSLLRDIELQVLHYLHNICPDKKMKKKTLFYISLAKKIISECLQLGDSFFTQCLCLEL